jgi:hypothetical protein
LPQRKEAIAVAHDVLETLGEDALGFVAKKIEEAEAYRDGELVTKWLLVREAVQELLQRPHPLDGGPPESGR